MIVNSSVVKGVAIFGFLYILLAFVTFFAIALLWDRDKAAQTSAEKLENDIKTLSEPLNNIDMDLKTLYIPS